MERKLGRVKIGKVGGEGKRSVGGCSLGIRYTVYLETDAPANIYGSMMAISRCFLSCPLRQY